jgi:hypothetical protein
MMIHIPVMHIPLPILAGMVLWTFVGGMMFGVLMYIKFTTKAEQARSKPIEPCQRRRSHRPAS